MLVNFYNAGRAHFQRKKKFLRAEINVKHDYEIERN